MFNFLFCHIIANILLIYSMSFVCIDSIKSSWLRSRCPSCVFSVWFSAVGRTSPTVGRSRGRETFTRLPDDRQGFALLPPAVAPASVPSSRGPCRCSPSARSAWRERRAPSRSGVTTVSLLSAVTDVRGLEVIVIQTDGGGGLVDWNLCQIRCGSHIHKFILM